MALVSLLAFAAIVGVLAIAKYIENVKNNRLPPGVQKLPGPKGLPFIGNVHELPEKNSWMKFHEWAEEFGPIYQVNLAGTNHVWISRDSVAHELLSKRSGNYSDRPFIPALEHDNRDSGQYLPLMSKNDKWTRQRKFAKQIMDTSAKEEFYGYPELESIRLLFEVMTEPSRYNHALESFVARVTCRLGWGTPSAAEELKQRARELLIGVSPTGSFANKLPFIMSLPESWTKSKAWELRRGRTERKFFETMQEEVRQQIKSSEKHSDAPAPILPSLQPKNSWMRMFLENKKAWKFDSDLEGAYAVGMHGIAGALTVAAPMQSFCLALCHYPHHQQILHEEIDRVLGDRMIRFSDMPDMPVLRAFIRETLRWRPPVPTGIPHASVKDDIYDGYHIPAGSVIHPLEWSISRDPEVFYEPDIWNPMRWLESQYPTYQEPLSKFPMITGYSQFGYGRRTCQGMGVTEADLFVGLGSMAWMFSMHTDSGDAEELSAPNNDYFTHKTEQKVRRAQGTAGRPHTPPNEEFIAQALHDKTNRRNDSVTGVQGDIFETPEFPGQGMPGIFPNLASRLDLPSARHTFDIPPSPAEDDVSFSFDFEKHITKAPLSSPTAGTDKTKPANDPTMDFSTLLIAKPNPFKFNLRIRDQGKADRIARRWMELKMDGEFEDSRVFWKDGNKGDQQHGWGEVFA